MVLFIAAFLAQGAHCRAALDRADALYAEFDPYPRMPQSMYLCEVLHEYRQVMADYGRISCAEAGLGKCYFLQGSYRDAAAAFAIAGPRYRRRYDEAVEYARTSEAICRRRKRPVVHQLRHIPNSNRWVALLGYSTMMPGWQYYSLAVYVKEYKTNEVHQIGKAKVLGKFYVEEDRSGLYVTKLSLKDPKWTILFFCPGGMVDCAFVDIQVLSVGRLGLRVIREFTPYEGASFQKPTAEHGLLVKEAPLFHTSWSDLYEWREGKFVLANRRFPSFFKLKRDIGVAYRDWMERGAVLDIHRSFGEARLAWRKALVAARLSIWRKNNGAEDPYRDPGFYGEARTCIRQIRKRLGWLANHDYNHTLLYRPTSRGL